jgi:hypothetical protein
VQLVKSGEAGLKQIRTQLRREHGVR